LTYVTFTGVDGQILQGRELVVETPLRTRQALLLLSDVANLLTIAAEKGSSPMPAELIKAPWFSRLTPDEQMSELREQLRGATDQFVLAELEIRAAARRRNRALSIMRNVRFTMIDLATRSKPSRPTIARMAGSRASRSASFTSS
jgi:hypothetical protein